MTSSILLRSPPRPAPSPAATPLPALQVDLPSSSSTSGSCSDFHHSSSTPSTRRIRFAPLPDPHRDSFDPLDPPSTDPQPGPRHPPQPVLAPSRDGSVVLSPSISPDSTVSSTRSTPTLHASQNAPSKNSPKSNLKILRPFSFLRRADSSPSESPLSKSASLPSPRDLSPPSLVPSSSSVTPSPSFKSPKFSRISAEDILTLGARSLFRAHSGSASISPLSRTSSPPPKSLDPAKSLHRAASAGSASGVNPDYTKPGREGSGQSLVAAAIAGSGPKKRRASSSALTPGAAGGRHTSPIKMPSNSPARPNTAPSLPLTPPKKHVKMLNGRIYGAKRYAAQTLANPFANVRDEPEFVEWGYGGMGSVHASVGIANDIWKGLQRSERGGTLLAGSSRGSSSTSAYPAAGAVTAGGGRGGGARATSPIVRRKMSESAPECGMGNVTAGGEWGDDDGSGMGWVKRRRAEKEAKIRSEQEGTRNGDSVDASIYASTASTTTSLTACTSAASTNLTTPTTSPLPSRTSSVTDLKLASLPFSESGEQSIKSDTSTPSLSVPKDEHGHHVLTAVRLSPGLSSLSHKHSQSATHSRTPSLSHALSQIVKGKDSEGTRQTPPLSPVDTEETTSADSSDEDEEEQDDVDDADDEAQDIGRKTALGAGVEKVSRHVDVEAR